jgi:glycosyltransferase involved in cell wall biosynthesis
MFESRNMQKSDVHARPVDYSKEINNSSQLLSSAPLVSVIIPTLNRYVYLRDVLMDLGAQSYNNFEVLICDQSEPVNKAFYQQAESDFGLKIKLIIQEEKALWKARNTCIRESKGEFILLFDDDSRVDPDWIENHLRCLDCFDVDISSGVSLSSVGDKIPAHYAFFRWSDQLDTGNVMMHRKVFSKVGLFDRQFEKQRMGDGEFGLRCYSKGITNISNPLAKRIHLKVSSGGLRQMGSWDGFRPKKWFAPRPVPSVLYMVRKYFGSATALRMVLLQVPFSVMPYKYKGKTKYNILSVLIFALLFPVFCLQILVSWQKASKMLKEGAIIESL